MSTKQLQLMFKAFRGVFAGACVVLLCSSDCSEAHPETRPSTDMSSGSSSIPLTTSIMPSRRGEIWEDITSSVDESDLPSVRKALGDVLDPLSLSEDVADWHLFQFGDDSWRTAEISAVDLPRYKPQPCNEVANAGEVGIFRRREDEEKSKADCEAKNAKALADATSTRNTKLIEFIDKWQRSARRPAKCTALHDALERITLNNSATRAIVITDGVETCLHSFQVIPAPRDDVKIVVLLITPVNAPVGRGISLEKGFQHRAELIQRALPWVKVVPLFQFDQSIFQQR